MPNVITTSARNNEGCQGNIFKSPKKTAGALERVPAVLWQTADLTFEREAPLHHVDPDRILGAKFSLQNYF